MSLSKYFVPFSEEQKIKITTWLNPGLPYLIIFFIGVIVFVGQNASVGFEYGHHGWVSAHTLAIINRADWDHHFVGYTLQSKNEAGQTNYHYFDRYPVFFSAAMYFILSFWENNLPAKVYAARQVMNLIYIITLIIAFCLLNKLTDNKFLALSVVLMAFSSYLLLFFKDMVHFDQPALLGFLLLIWAILLFKQEGRRWLLYTVTLIAVGLGRGYAVYAILLLWNFFELITLVKVTGFNLSEIVKRTYRQDAFRVLLLAIFWGSALLTYNIYTESMVRNVPLTQTSIIVSVFSRLALNEKFNQTNSSSLNWASFTWGQIERIVDFIIPIGHLYLGNFKYLILIPMLWFIPRFIKQQSQPHRLILLILILSGFAWLFPMRNLAAFHSYTVMYYIGLSLVFYLANFSLGVIKKHAGYLLVLSIIVFVSSLFVVNRVHSSQAKQVNIYTYDFYQISQLVESGKNIYYPEGHTNLVPGVPYAVGFYLAQNYISPLKTADYIISTDRNYQALTLTPHNKEFFLFVKQ